jgi:hypothetical protein
MHDIVYTMGKCGVKYNFHDFLHFPQEGSGGVYEKSYNFHISHKAIQNYFAPEFACGKCPKSYNFQVFP